MDLKMDKDIKSKGMIFKVKEYIDSHREQIDLFVGGGIGAGTGIDHYWEHFTSPANLYNLLDGIINTGLHTIVGAFLLWVIHKYILKSKKK